MLRNYCSRKSQIAFSARTEEQKMKANKTIFKISATAVCLVAVLSAGIFSSLLFGRYKSQETGVPSGFSITAYAAENEQEPVVLSNIKTELSSNGGENSFPDIVVDYNERYGKLISVEPITFSISGKKLESIDFSCGNGYLNYIIPELKEQKLNGDNYISQDDYFKKGKKLENVPYKNGNPHYANVYWYPGDRDTKELSEYLAQHGYTDDELSELYETDDELARLRKEFRDKILNTSEDLTDYYGDTITVTVHYNDGTTESADIEVAVNYEQIGGTDTLEDGTTENYGIGKYVLSYK